MADFSLFEPLLLKQEGFYSNKPNDSGGETWEGIARNDYPNSLIWPIVDSYKGRPDFPHILRSDTKLQALVDNFYKLEFWSKMMGDQIQNQSIANYIGDWGVNAGLSVPIKHAQTILGIASDGKIGPNTLNAINSANGADFFSKLVQARVDFYHAVVAAHPNYQEFLSDWLERAHSFQYKA